jgi:hypothetical protein
MNAMKQAFAAQNIDVAWRGPMPSDPAELTADYLAAMVDGLPRMRPADAVVDLDQLRADYQAALDAEAAKAQMAAADKTAQDTIRADNRLRNLLTATPQQIEAYIDNNVTNLAQAKEVLGLLALGLSMVARAQLHD